MFHAARCGLRIVRQPITHIVRRYFARTIVIFVFLLGTGFREYSVLILFAQSQGWESSIRKFEDDDKANPPKPGGIVFTGASSIRRWDALVEEMKPLEVMNRDFGGSQYSDLNQYGKKDRHCLPPRGGRGV
jgi:hypothetical protein